VSQLSVSPQRQSITAVTAAVRWQRAVVMTTWRVVVWLRYDTIEEFNVDSKAEYTA